mmetsp:Transcript_30554/g.59939  ORF Transcript_30554/g.59939 Transcript_30554/m.59939 type:complete len:80 (-) Transcript_30554:14-253(-)
MLDPSYAIESAQLSCSLPTRAQSGSRGKLDRKWKGHKRSTVRVAAAIAFVFRPTEAKQYWDFTGTPAEAPAQQQQQQQP